MIINYKRLQEEYDSYESQVICSFETQCLDVRMPQLLKCLIEQDWINAYFRSHNIRGSAGYAFAENIANSSRVLENFLNPYIERRDDDSGIRFILLSSFDDNKKIQALEYGLKIIDDANQLKKEISKISKSVVNENIYLEEGNYEQKIGELIKQKYINLKEGQKIFNQPQQDTACCQQCQIY